MKGEQYHEKEAENAYTEPYHISTIANGEKIIVGQFVEPKKRPNAELIKILNQAYTWHLEIINGASTQDIARQLRDKLNVSYRNAIRLARTETNFTANQAMQATYKRAKVEKYQVLATLDSRTSEICQEMDGYVGLLKNARVGENYPPFHPNCRTTTIPYFDDEDEEEERIARDEESENYFVKNMTYKQWLSKNNLADTTVPAADTDTRGAEAIK